MFRSAECGVFVGVSISLTKRGDIRLGDGRKQRSSLLEQIYEAVLLRASIPGLAGSLSALHAYSGAVSVGTISPADWDAFTVGGVSRR